MTPKANHYSTNIDWQDIFLAQELVTYLRIEGLYSNRYQCLYLIYIDVQVVFSSIH